MKITLIQPQKRKTGVVAEESWQLTRPFSLFFLASSIEKNTKCEVEIVDFEQKIYDNNKELVDSKIRETHSEVYGITATTYTRFEAVYISKKIKEFHPDALVIVGGVHFMFCPDDTLNNVPTIDLVIRGEGENIIVEVLKAFENKSDFKLIKGVSYRNGNEIIHTPNSEIFENLDEIPTYSKFSWDLYPEYLFSSSNNTKALSIMSSRGCPYKCIFCSKAGMKYRLRNPEKVVDEIENYVNKFGIKAFNFLDLTFTANPEHAKKICFEIIKRKLNISWWCESRVNIPLDLLDIMKEAGCKSLVIGVESGSPRILSKISKNVNLEQVMNFCKKCYDIKIGCWAYFMFSHPEETLEDLKETEAFIFKLRKYIQGFGIQPTMIFPGTELEIIAKSKNILPQDFSWYNEVNYELNNKLGQFDNIPLFIDKLVPENMIEFLSSIKLKESVYHVSKLSIFQIIVKTINALINRKSSLKYLFSYKYISELIKKCWNK